jgi:hypothetical protein
MILAPVTMRRMERAVSSITSKLLRLPLPTACRRRFTMTRNRWLYAILLITLIFVWMPPLPVKAQTSSITFSTAITYQNTGSTIAHVSILFYPAGSTTPVTISRPDLPVGASATVSVGSLNSSGFKGSAVVKSDGQVSVLMTQIPSSSTVKSRPNATGTNTGAGDFWFMNVAKTTTHTVFSVQNIDSKAADLSLVFYGSGTPVTITSSGLAAGASQYFDTATLSTLPSGSYSAVHVIAKRSGTTTTGKIIGTMMQMAADPFYDSSIESLTQTGQTLYFPIARCGGTAGRATKFLVFNTDSSSGTTVTMKYSTGQTVSYSIGALSGAWFDTCSNTGNSSTNGTAVVTSTDTNVIGIGYYVYGGLNTSFYGMAVGSSILAAPLVNYSAACWTTGDRQCTEIMIMNLGSALASGTVKVKYYDKNGNLVGTHTQGAIAAGGRVISTAANIGSAGAEFGYYADGTTGGSVIIEGPTGSNLVADVFTSWIAGTNLYTGDIYNAIPISMN